MLYIMIDIRHTTIEQLNDSNNIEMLLVNDVPAKNVSSSCPRMSTTSFR